MSLLFLLFVFFPLGNSTPLEAGQKGGPWTEEELDIVREKIVTMMDCEIEAQNGNNCWSDPGLPDNLNEGDLDLYSRDHDEFNLPRKYSNRWRWRYGPNHNRLIQLAFHDCLKYEDGTGGCDGCLNWKGVGYLAKNHRKNHYKWPQVNATDNNKLQMSARSLEFIYTLTDWPPGARSLPVSLKESGKSRADLWAFAGSVGLERAVLWSNLNCQNVNPYQNSQSQMKAMTGECEIQSKRQIPFRWGRIDCIPDESAKWSPYPFEATKAERHSNPFGTGNDVVDDLKRDFGLTAAETISLMALHGLAPFGHNRELMMRYKWIGGFGFNPYTGEGKQLGMFSNIYYKFLSGKRYRTKQKDYLVGDENGNPVGGASFGIFCGKAWYDPDPEHYSAGPCFFRPSKAGCGLSDSEFNVRKRCFVLTDGEFVKNPWIPGCESAEIIEKDGIFYQVGGPVEDKKSYCTKLGGFALPYEVSFMVNFTSINSKPGGCGVLDLDYLWRPHPEEEWKNQIYPGSPGEGGASNCGRNEYAPEGMALADIIDLFASDRQAWLETFFNAWEKMQINGYDLDDLTEAPAIGNLIA